MKVDLITGFLGAGKTTFLLGYARHLINRGLRIGILEYDYGPVNVDMVLLNSLRGPNCELEMVAAACDEDCLRRRFRTKLIAMAMSGYDRVIIEPSGIFDMDLFLDTLREEPLDSWCEIGSVLTVVNAEPENDFDEESDFVLASEAADAGCILLSRTQLVTPEDIRKTEEHVRSAAERIGCRKKLAEFLCKDWSTLTAEDYDRLMNAGYQVNDFVKVTAGRKSSFSSVIWLEPAGSPELLTEKVRKLLSDGKYGHVLRVKGFVQDKELCYQINATRRTLHTETKRTGPNIVIVIGSGLQEEKIRELLGSRV